MKIMFLGTSSNAGKTTVSAVFCRYSSLKGLSVSPFKGSNLSLNSYVTENGEEIGMGQAFQALAAGIEPTADMNPVLLKPSGNGRIQLILNGRPAFDISSIAHPSHDELMRKVCSSFERLEDSSDIVICEGSGSPAELNLMDTEVANMNLVREERIPSVIIGDIERGGVFAAIYGTWKLMKEDDRRYLRGFLINRFRGEPSILKSGIDRIEKMTGMSCLGIIPYLDLKFPEEDSMSSKMGRLSGSNVREAYLKNLDEFISDTKDSVNYERLIEISSEIIE